MATFLFVWNPKRYSIQDFLKEIKEAKSTDGILRWSCRSQEVSEGDRAFLIRLGAAPKGIVAAGTIKGATYLAPHWDSPHAGIDAVTSYVDVLIDDVDVHAEPILAREELSDLAPEFRWDSQSSGIRIQPESVAERLEALWMERTGTEFRLPEEVAVAVSLHEGALKQIQVNAYERNGKARRTCLLHHGWACGICGFDFGKAYGSKVEGLIHVHHLKSLAEIGHSYQVDPIKDLMPVCPNCHAVIHSGPDLRTPDEVKAMISDVWTH